MHIPGQHALDPRRRAGLAAARRRCVPGRVAGLVGGLGVGRPARVQHQHRHPGGGQQPPQRSARRPAAGSPHCRGPRTAGTRAGPAAPARPPTPRTAAATAPTPPPPPAAGRRSGLDAEVGQVEPGAVPVEMHHVIRPPRIHAPRAAPATAGRRWPGAARPGPGPPSARPRRGPGGRPPTGTAHPPGRPAGRSPAAPAAGPRPAPAAPGARPPAGACGRTPPPPAPPPHPGPDRAAAPTPAPAPRPGRRPPPPAPHPAGPAPAPRSPPHPRSANTRPEQLRARLRQLRLRLPRDHRRRISRELRVILQIPADPLPVPVIGRSSELGHRHPARRPRPASVTSTRRPPPGPAGMSLIRSSATTPPPG